MAAAQPVASEDANKGQFGEDFQEIQFLSNAEVAVLLADDSMAGADQLPV